MNVEVATKPDLESIDPIRVVIESKERELGNAGRILVRYSGTENKARVMVECEDEVTCNQHAREVAEVIEREIGGSV